ncbi:MAG: hypothetical protein KC713_05720 [Candidatus Omnitrophica bacterium]|nr:hypothetical protein [Candidatus Omnitrophota bacterium]
MRMFLIGMCDIFLILYLTSITNTQPKSILTVDDFFQLKAMHESLQGDQQRAEAELREQLRKEQEAKDRLQAQLAREKERLDETKRTLSMSAAERKKIEEELRLKEQMLKSREELLANLNQEIAAKEQARQTMESTYQKELALKKETIESTQEMAIRLKEEAQNAQLLADKMKAEADLAYKTADTAKAVQQKALVLKTEALKEKELAERKAAEALRAKQEAEEEKRKAMEAKLRAEKEKTDALIAMEVAKTLRQQAEENAQELVTTIKDIKKDAKSVYQQDISPQIQNVQAAYERQIADNVTVYERELTLVPVMLDGKIFVIFPTQQIGFTKRSDTVPRKLMIQYKGQKIKNGWIDKENDLIALELSSYVGPAYSLYPADKKTEDFMPTLMAVRNNGNISLLDKIRGISDDFFIVNKNYLTVDGGRVLKYEMPGIRGTGLHGERIVRGDQLLDLKGQLIGIANDANQIIRIDTLKEWDKITF